MNQVISFIIPTYNSEKTIERCIFSIFCNNDNFNYEILVIDDASEDNTKNIVKELQKMHRNLYLIESTHQGAQESRMVGLQKAKGSLVFFLDSDDYIDSNFIIEVNRKFKEENFDLLLINAAVITKDKQNILISKDTFKYVLENSALQEAVVFGRFGFNCCHVYKKDFLLKCDLSSIEKLTYTEDLNFYIQVLMNNPKVSVLDKKLYFYNFNDHKLSKLINKQKFYDAIYVLKRRFSITNALFSDHSSFFYISNRIVLLDLMMAVVLTKNLSRKEKKEIVKNCKNDAFIRELIGTIKTYKTFKDKIKYILFWVLC